MNKKKIISVTGRKKKSDSQKEYVTEKKKEPSGIKSYYNKTEIKFECPR